MQGNNVLHIAIDPDVEASGVATIDKENKTIELRKLDLPKLYEYIKRIDNGIHTIKVFIEKHQTDASWHLNPRMTARAAAKVGHNVGRNFQVEQDIVSILKTLVGVQINEVAPLNKQGSGFHYWSGRDGKVTQEELNSVLKNAGFMPIGRTNQDVRDAILLGLVHANVPIRCSIMRTHRVPNR